MEFKIENGPVFTTLRIIFNSGEQFRAEAGAMVYMTPGIDLQAKASGKGLLGTLKAAVGGESFFAALYTCESPNGEILLAPGSIGDILRIDMKGQTIYAEGGAYLAGSPDFEISTKGSLKGMISGEGLFLQRISGSGTLFLSSYGSIIEHTLSPGQSIIVDTGHLVAFEESVQYRVKTASKGLISSFASGEGLVCEYTGPGKLWIQSRNMPVFAGMLSKYIVK